MKPLNELTDAELSECFAVEVAGWKIPSGCTNYRTQPDGVVIFFNPLTDNDPVPEYSTSADAVLPWLEKLVNRRAFNDHSIIVTGENYYINGPSGTLSKATTLARAACIALIEAKRRRDGK